MDSEIVKPSTGAFFGLTFLLSLPFWLLGAVRDNALLPGLPISALMVVCPVLSAGILSWRAGGGNALWAFLRQGADWNKLPGWAWGLAIGAMPLVMILAALMQIAMGADVPAPQWTLAQTLTLFALFLAAGLAEELGWTGYATRPLGASYGVVGTGLIIGIAAAVWHLLPLLQAGSWWRVDRVVGTGDPVTSHLHRLALFSRWLQCFRRVVDSRNEQSELDAVSRDGLAL